MSIVDRLIASDRVQRFGSACALLDALDQLHVTLAASRVLAAIVRSVRQRPV